MRSEFDTLEQYQESMKEFNENTRMGFEEFIQSHGSDRNKLQLRCTPYTSKKGGYGSFDLDFGLCVYQHQQSKVDELQKRVDDLELTIKGAVTFVDLQIEATEQGREAAIGTQAKNWWSSKLLMLRPIRRVLEQALKGGEA